jgi:hypothetical protein
MAYVIKEWLASEAPNQDGVFISIKGREGGLLSFLLSLVGINPTVSLVVDGQNLRFEEGSLAGFFRWVTPLTNVCSGGYGYRKPWKPAVIIAILGTLTVWLAPLFWIGAALYYALNKELSVRLGDFGGKTYGIAFKRSVIERIKVDEDEAARVVRIIEGLLTRARPPVDVSTAIATRPGTA